MFKTYKNKSSLFILTFILCSQTIFAQSGEDDPGGLNGDPGSAVPIDNWIPAIILLAIATVFYYTHKKQSIKN